GQADQPALSVVLGEAGYRADLVEAAGVDQGVDALAHGQLAVGVVPGDLLGAAHLPGEFLPTGVLVDLGLPAHRVSVVSWLVLAPMIRPCPEPTGGDHAPLCRKHLD